MTNEQKREEKQKLLLERLQEMSYFDDEFMTKCLEDYPKGVELMLRIIMNDAKLVVKEAQVQAVIKNLQGRSIRMDVKTNDVSKKQYDVELQRADSGAKPKRARYNSSLMDANSILPGDDTEMLAETYVVFITENDVLEGNLPIYHIDRTIQETGALFNDKAHIIYVNGEIKDDTPLGRLMHDLSCADPDDMNYKELADRARYFKKDEEGRKIMSKIMEQLLNEEKIEAAKRMLERGKLTKEEIAEDLDLPLSVVERLENDLQLA